MDLKNIFLKSYEIPIVGTFELFDIITILLSIILIILSFIDLVFTYKNYNKSKLWEYTIGSTTFFLPIAITLLQWQYERNRRCNKECKILPQSLYNISAK